MANSFDVSVSSEYFNSLASPEALADGSLSAEELAADAEGAALVAALQQQIADQLGVDPDATVRPPRGPPSHQASHAARLAAA